VQQSEQTVKKFENMFTLHEHDGHCMMA